MLLHDAADLPAIATGHHHIKEDERRLHCLEQSQRFIAVMRNRYWISANLEVLADDLGIVVIIVDHQDRRQVGVLHAFGDSGWCAARACAGLLSRGQDASHLPACADNVRYSRAEGCARRLA